MLCKFQVYSKVNRLYVYIYPLFFRFFSHIGHYRVLSRVPCAIQQVLICYLFYIQQCVYVSPNLPIYPSASYPLVTISLFSVSVTLLLFYFIYFFKLINLFIFGCVRSSFLCEGFLQLQQLGVTLHRGARASHCRGLSCCGSQAPHAQAQQLWLTGLVAPWHVGSSRTRDRTCVPCIGRQILNHCATREAPIYFCFINKFICTLFFLNIPYISNII